MCQPPLTHATHAQHPLYQCCRTGRGSSPARRTGWRRQPQTLPWPTQTTQVLLLPMRRTLATAARCAAAFAAKPLPWASLRRLSAVPATAASDAAPFVSDSGIAARVSELATEPGIDGALFASRVIIEQLKAGSISLNDPAVASAFARTVGGMGGVGRHTQLLDVLNTFIGVVRDASASLSPVTARSVLGVWDAFAAAALARVETDLIVHVMSAVVQERALLSTVTVRDIISMYDAVTKSARLESQRYAVDATLRQPVFDHAPCPPLSEKQWRSVVDAAIAHCVEPHTSSESYDVMVCLAKLGMVRQTFEQFDRYNEVRLWPCCV